MKNRKNSNQIAEFYSTPRTIAPLTPINPLTPHTDDFKKPTYPLFQNQREQLLYSKMIVEGYRLQYPSIPMFLIDFEKTQIDKLLGEASHRVYKGPFYIPGHVQWSPPVYILHRYGIETEQEVLVTFPDLALKLAGIDLRSMLGGVLVMDLDKEKERTRYEIIEVHKQPQDAWSVYGDVMNIAVTVDVEVQSSIHLEEELPEYEPSFGLPDLYLPNQYPIEYP